jgi:signal transduction histidine kinase
MIATPTHEPSLVRTITLRLAVTAALAIFLQLTIVVARSYLIEEDLNRSYVTREAQSLLRIVRAGPQGVSLAPGRTPAHYRNEHAAHYAFRILDESGKIVGAHQGGLLGDLSPWRSGPSRTQDLWLLDLSQEKKLYVAGGLRHKIGNKDIWVEVATLGDPAGLYLGILAAEVVDDVWMPMIPLVVLTLGVAVVSVRRSLSGLVLAAEQAQRISPLQPASRFDVSDMPLEAASFATAINGLLDRVGSLVSAQRLFIARAAHELRTPLSVIMLELGRIEDPRVRRLEADVRAMSSTVDHLLTLARLESSAAVELVDLDLGQIATELVMRLEDWVEANRHKIELEVREPARIAGDVSAVREAMRNLIENAVHHTPPGTNIRLTVGPYGVVVIEDDGPGLGTEVAAELLEPFKKARDSGTGAGLGLAIVKQAVELHNGAIEIGRSDSGGAKFTLRFPDGPAAIPAKPVEAAVREFA